MEQKTASTNPITKAAVVPKVETEEAKAKREALLAKVDEAAANVDEALEENDEEMKKLDDPIEADRGLSEFEQAVEELLGFLGVPEGMVLVGMGFIEQTSPCDTCPCGIPQAYCTKSGGEQGGWGQYR